MNRKLHTSLKFLAGTLLLLTFTLESVQAQIGRRKVNDQSTTYEEIYDDPYDINKLFLQLQPLYGELFVANVNVGFGVEAQYYWSNKFDFKAHLRKAYAPRFDFSRDIANKISDNQLPTQIFTYYEFGATYHLKDVAYDSETRVVLYSKRYKKDNKWASKVPEKTDPIPATVRRIIGIRAGGLYYATTTDLKQAMLKQNVWLSKNDTEIASDADIYGNLRSSSVYLGTSIAWFRNFAGKFDYYGNLVNDQLVTLFFDIMYAPYLELEDVLYNDVTYSTDAIKTNPFGLRFGIDGKFNREVGWAYGAEIGMRPSVKGRSFYGVLKVSFPVYGTSLDYSKEAFGK